MKKYFSKEVKIALIVIGALFSIIWSYNFLKGSNIFSSTQNYYAIVPDASGLAPGVPVLINGVSVGAITDIILNPVSNKVLVQFNIDNAYKISTKSTAQITQTSLMGGNSFVINALFSKPFFKNGDTLPTLNASGMFDGVSAMQPDLKSSMKNISTITTNVNDMLDGNTKMNLQATIYNLNKATEQLTILISQFSQSTSTLKSTFNNINGITSNLNAKNGGVNHLMSNINNTTDQIAQLELKKTMDHLNASISNLNGVLASANSKDGSLGLLLNDKAIHNDLDQTINALNNLLTDLKQHPKRYVSFSLIGRKEKNNEQK